MNNKKGITLTSLVIYLVLFTVFTVFTMNISTNMNESLLNDRGEAINYTNLVKLKANIETSTLASNDVTIDGNKITYSNGDEYLYDGINANIKKNGGIICTNVTSFNLNITSGNSVKKLSINVGFNKYLNELNTEIISTVEEWKWEKKDQPQ